MTTAQSMLFQPEQEFSPEQKIAIRHGDTSEINHIIYPDDSYLNGVYWADLPRAQRWKWINNQQNTETKRECALLWAMFKKDPLEPIRAYFRTYVVNGLGLFVEGYVLFSIGNLQPLFAVVWPTCWGSKRTVCNTTWVDSVTYLEIVGIILGQVLVGFIGDYVGRRWGLVQDALIMFTGTLMLCASWGASLEGWVIMYAISLLWYGIGVGGEYPMTATKSMEGKVGRNSSNADKLHRGRNVSLAFLMQGWGQLANQGALIICLLIFHGSSHAPYAKGSTQYTFRVQFGLVAFATLWLAYYRFFKVKYADAALNQAKKRGGVTGYDVASLKLTGGFYWHRLIGTAGAWYCNDIFFYGNKIFQGKFISVITGKYGADVVFTNWMWNLVNIGVSLVGYYLAALFIDNKFYGRSRMQTVGFMADFILFIAAAADYGSLSKSQPHAFMAIYFLSSFFQQFGPNATTFLLAAEVFPAPIRSTAHGVSAAVGKLGALTATIAYNYIDTETKIWVVCWFGLLGAALTILFIPDTTGLDLREQERFWNFVKVGKLDQYHGIAIHKRHLSNWEIYVLKRHLNYNPELDAQMRVDELKADYQASLYSTDEDGSHEEFDSKVISYFEKQGLALKTREKSAGGSSSGSEELDVNKNSNTMLNETNRVNTDSLFREMNRA